MWDTSKNKDIFTTGNVRKMCQMEATLWKTKSFKDFCYLGPYCPKGDEKNCPCEPFPVSIANVFYGNMDLMAQGGTAWGHNFDCPKLNETFVTSRKKWLYDKMIWANANPDDPLAEMDLAMYGVYFSKDFVDSCGAGALTAGVGTAYGSAMQSSDCVNRRTRSIMSVGEPLKGYKDSADRMGEQQMKYLSLWREFEPAMLKLGRDGSEATSDWRGQSIFLDRHWTSCGDKDADQDVGECHDEESADSLEFVHGGMFMFSDILRILEVDITYVMLSLVAVHAIVWMYTASLWIASAHMYQVFMSIGFAFLLYRYILMADYFTFMGILSIFLGLGVGADDLFVFHDCWLDVRDKFKVLQLGIAIENGNGPTEPDAEPKEGAWRDYDNSGIQPPAPDKNMQFEAMYIAYERMMLAVFNTSFTTCVAFFACSISPLMPISAFGQYAAMLILANYLFTLWITPSVLICYENYYSWKKNACNQCCCAVCINVLPGMAHGLKSL